MKAYLDVVRKVLDNGTRKSNRTGIDTISLFNVNYQVSLRAGFPLLTTKKISWKNIVVELLWFLSGETHIDILRKHRCYFWDPWADENGKVPSAYGNFWRHYPVHGPILPAYNDQIAWVIKELKRNPSSRRLVVTAWAPGNAQTSALPPCHAMFVLNVQRDKRGEPVLNLHLTQRSADIALGVPYNLASYALLLHLFARFTGLTPGSFAHSMIDAHIYTARHDGGMGRYDHVPGLREQLTREPLPLPTIDIDSNIRSLQDVEALIHEDTATILNAFRLYDYEAWPAIKFRVAV